MPVQPAVFLLHLHSTWTVLSRTHRWFTMRNAEVQDGTSCFVAGMRASAATIEAEVLLSQSRRGAAAKRRGLERVRPVVGISKPERTGSVMLL
jgi:hypothetical protein